MRRVGGGATVSGAVVLYRSMVRLSDVGYRVEVKNFCTHKHAGGIKTESFHKIDFRYLRFS